MSSVPKSLGLTSVRAREPADEKVDGITQRQQRERIDAVLRVAPDRADEEDERADEREARREGVAPCAVGPRRVGFAAAEREDGEERERVVRDEEEGDGREQTLELAAEDDHRDRRRRRERQRSDGRAAPVDARRAAPEKPVAPH